MSFEVSPWSGLFRPAADKVPAGRWSDAGLIVPDRSLAAARLGLVPAETPSAWFDRYVKAYVTAGDYLTGALAAGGLPFDPVPLISSLLRLHPVRCTCRSWWRSTTPRIIRSWPRHGGSGSWPG